MFCSSMPQGQVVPGSTRQSHLAPEHICAIVETYKFRKEEDRFSRRVEMDEIDRLL